MKIVITTGHPECGLAQVYALLCAAGLSAAQPSQRDGWSPAEFHTALLKAHDLSATPLAEVAGLAPGGVWLQLASDLFANNLSGADWGWAEARSLGLLRFWTDFDPQVRVVLVYAAPEYLLATRAGPAPALKPWLASWQEHHEALLRFYHRHADRAVLINAAAALADPAQCISRISAAWGMALNATDAAMAPANPPALGVQAARWWLEGEHEVAALLAELESAATLPSPAAMAGEMSRLAVWEDYLALRAEAGRAALLAPLAQVRDEQTALAHARQLQLVTLRTAYEEQAQLAVDRQALLVQLAGDKENLEQTLGERETQLASAQQAQLGLEHSVASHLLQIQTLAQGENEALVACAQAAAQCDTLTQLATDHVQWLAALKLENEGLQGQTAKQRDHIEQLEALHAQQTRVAAEQATQLAEVTRTQTAAEQLCREALATLTEENELLLLQLHQVQEELEHYFLRHEEAERNGAQAREELQILGQAEAAATGALAQATAELAQLSAAQVDQLTQLKQLTLARNEQAVLADEYQTQLAQLLQERDETAKLLAERQAQIEQLTVARDEQSQLAVAGQTQLAQSLQTHAEMAQQLAERQAQLEQQAMTQGRTDSAAAALDHLREENELLLLQLHQVQEELEHYFLLSQKTVPADLPARHCLVDFRQHLDGSNWYPPEADGSWAGPRTSGTLRVPALAAGRYQLMLDVVDTKAPHIVSDMQLLLNGKLLPLSHHGDLLRPLITADFSSLHTAGAQHWEFTFKFPSVLSPADEGWDDRRYLAVRIKTLAVRPLD